MDSNILSAFELNKNNARTNLIAHIHETPIIHYGRITKVIDIQTVVVEAVIRTSLAKDIFTVTLLSLSSAIFELNIHPKVGDTVLLLFLQRHDPLMFKQETVNNQNAVGYNKFSGVGILMSTVKGFADTVIHHCEAGNDTVTRLESNSNWTAEFNNEFSLAFCRYVHDSNDETLINVLFGEGRPFFTQFLSTVVKEYGFWRDGDDNLIELNAAVTERYSVHAPITKDIQGSQDITIGIGENGDTEAPIDIEIGGNADVILNSESALTAKFKKAVSIKCDSTEMLEIGNTIGTLGALIGDLIDIVSNINTVGGPAAQNLNPALKLQAEALKLQWDQVFS